MYVNGNYQFLSIDGNSGDVNNSQKKESIKDDTTTIFKDMKPKKNENDDNSTNQLNDLYTKLSNAASEEESEAIRAEIKSTLDEYNYDDDEILESLFAQSESIRQSYTNNIEKLIQQSVQTLKRQYRLKSKNLKQECSKKQMRLK